MASASVFFPILPARGPVFPTLAAPLAPGTYSAENSAVLFSKKAAMPSF